MEDKITLDKTTLKALAVDSRLNILKLLSQKSYTLSDIALELSLSKPTVKEHLEVLVNAKLVKKEATSRKWKYYSLTLNGKRLIQPTEVKVMFAFVTTLVAAFGVALSGFLKIFSPFRNSSMLMAKSSARSMIAQDVAMDLVVEESASSGLLAASNVAPEAMLFADEIPNATGLVFQDTQLLIVFGVAALLLLASAFLLGYLMHKKTVIITNSKK